MTRPLAALALALVAAVTLTACVENTPRTSGTPGATAASAGTTVTIAGDDPKCTVSTTSVSSGTVTFALTNAGSDVTEFELLAADGLRIVSEKENIGPGTTGTVTAQLAPGSYWTACIPRLVGQGQRARFTVTDSGATIAATGTQAEQRAAAATAYVGYVRDQMGQLVTATQTFVDAWLAGDTATAKRLYAPTRVHYERIETVAESFGDLDPQLDNRAADLSAGDTWTGWHRIEKDLFAPTATTHGGAGYGPMSAYERTAMATQLTTNTRQLHDEVAKAGFTVGLDTIANGAVGLLDEVARKKITGEEEIWSHTDLTDFEANLQGARVAYEGVRPLLVTKDRSLATQLDGRFADLEKQLAAYGSLARGYPSYLRLTATDKRSLSNGVNALSEPLSTLAAALLS